MRSFARIVLFDAVVRPLGWIMLFSCFLNLSYLAAPLYMMQVYDRVMRSQSIPTLLYLSLAVAIAYAAFASLDGTRAQILASVSDLVEEALATRLLQGATAPTTNRHPRPGAGHLGRDLDTVRQFMSGAAILAIMDLPWATVYIGALFLIHWILGAFTLCTGFALFLLSLLNECVVGGPMAQANSTANYAYNFGDAIVRHPDCASSMGLGPGLSARWAQWRDRMLSAQHLASRRAIIIASLARFTRMFTQSGVLGVGAYLAIDHRISAGAIFAGSLLLGRALAPIESLITSWRSMLVARNAWSHISTVIEQTGDKATELPEPSGDIVLQDVSWGPADSVPPVLVEVTLSLGAGMIVTVIGPNAAGKSTLGRIIVGAIRANEGTVRLDGAEYSAWDASQLGRAIGYLPQDCALFPGTIRDNIARFSDTSDQTVIKAAQAAMVHQMILQLPMGYETLVDDSCASLSRGQKQRIAMARALLWNPPVVVMDEPSASLDAEGETALFHCISALREQKKTLVMITHNAALVRTSDLVVTMLRGRIVRTQRPAELFTRPRAAAVAAGN